MAVYNFEVAGAHTNYVASPTAPRAPPVLAHNSCGPDAKKVPNLYGRRGSPAHRAKIIEVQERLEKEGSELVAGARTEEMNFGRRCPDLVMREGDRLIAVQVGHRTKGLRLPVAREGKALEELRSLMEDGKKVFDHVFFLAY